MDKEKIKQELKTNKHFRIAAEILVGTVYFGLIAAIVPSIFFLLLNFFPSGMVAVIITISILIFFIYIVFSRFRKKERADLISGFVSMFLGIAITVLVYYLILGAALHDSRGVPRTMQLAGKIRYIEVYFDAYYQENGYYPPAEDKCKNINEINYNIEDFGDLEKLVSEPLREGEIKPTYQYSSSSDGEQYVIKVPRADLILRSSESSLFEHDKELDGNILGCNCDDPNYCVGVLE